MTSELENYIKVQETVNNIVINKYSRGMTCLDGIYSPEVYFNRKDDRITFVLMEAHTKEVGGWDPVDKPKNDYVIKPDKNNHVANEIIKNFEDFLSDYDNKKTNELKGVGYINVSKKRNLQSKANKSVIRNTFKETFDSVLYPQLKAFNPKYIVFCGTFDLFWDTLEKQYEGRFYRLHFLSTPLDDVFTNKLNNFKDKPLSFWRMKDEGPILIQTYHPSCRGKYENKFPYIVPAIKKCQKGEYTLINY